MLFSFFTFIRCTSIIGAFLFPLLLLKCFFHLFKWFAPYRHRWLFSNEEISSRSFPFAWSFIILLLIIELLIFSLHTVSSFYLLFSVFLFILTNFTILSIFSVLSGGYSAVSLKTFLLFNCHVFSSSPTKFFHLYDWQGRTGKIQYFPCVLYHHCPQFHTLPKQQVRVIFLIAATYYYIWPTVVCVCVCIMRRLFFLGQ